MSEKDRERYENAMHAVQTGVAVSLDMGSSEATPKHLRVGINAALVDSGALATLLISKGLITVDEYQAALADMAEKERDRYEAALSALGAKVTLI
jgi:hypothetical protein